MADRVGTLNYMVAIQFTCPALYQSLLLTYMLPGLKPTGRFLATNPCASSSSSLEPLSSPENTIPRLAARIIAPFISVYKGLSDQTPLSETATQKVDIEGCMVLVKYITYNNMQYAHKIAQT